MSSTDKKISLADAIAWTKNWRLAPSTAARAFLIPIEDLQGVINEIKSQGGDPCARAYLAIDGTGEEKLVIVGTSQDTTTTPGTTIYRDLLPSATEDYETATNSIYDFTKPCPTYCDPSSDLN